MQSSLRTLMDEAIDYAGVFPPAGLELAPALDRYRRHAAGPEAVLVGRFLCRSEQLAPLAQMILDEDLRDFRVGVIAGAPATVQEWDATLERHAEELNRFYQTLEDRAEIETYEIRLPDTANLPRYLDQLEGFDDADIFVEVPDLKSPHDVLVALTEREAFGAKARLGGVDAAAFPSVSAVAAFIHECVSLELPFKLTAGLHHAFPTADPKLGVTTFGYINVLGATVLALAEDLSPSEIAAVLSAPQGDWKFDRDAIQVRGYEADLEDIDEGRELFMAFGSCSVSEPWEELLGLGKA